jgi:hypothetical protein
MGKSDPKSAPPPAVPVAADVDVCGRAVTLAERLLGEALAQQTRAERAEAAKRG